MQKIGQQCVGRPTPLAPHPLYFYLICLLACFGCTLVSPPPDQLPLGPTRGATLRHGYRSAWAYLCFRIFFDCLQELDYDQGWSPSMEHLSRPQSLLLFGPSVELFPFFFLGWPPIICRFLFPANLPFNLTQYSQPNSTTTLFSLLLSDYPLFIAI